MDVLFLGTAAAEGYPGAFCRCRNCLRASKEGGRSLRKRSAILVDDELLIDIPPDLYWSAITHNVDLAHLHSILVTHSHGDHFHPQILEYRKSSFALMPLPTLTLFCDNAVMPLVKSAVGRIDEARLRLRSIRPYRRYGAKRFDFTPIPANHMTSIRGEVPYNYILECDGREILYASDTGFYASEVLSFLLRRNFDMIIVECTMGDKFYKYHMNYELVLALHQWAKWNCVLKRGRNLLSRIWHMMAAEPTQR